MKNFTLLKELPEITANKEFVKLTKNKVFVGFSISIEINSVDFGTYYYTNKQSEIECQSDFNDLNIIING